jgi:chromosome partitioning protein
MPTIAIAIPKGGAGKTTTALVVALELAQREGSVAILDGDRNGHIVEWASWPGVPPNVSVAAAKLETMVDDVNAAARRSAFVIVDLEGTANPMVSLAVTLADLVIIPVQGSHLDAKEAVQMIRLIRHQEDVSKRPIPYAVLMTRTNPAIIPGSQKQVERTLSEGAIPAFQTQLHDREAYRALFAYGGTLQSLKDRGIRNIEAAERNAQALAAEVIERIKPRQPQASKPPLKLPPAPQLAGLGSAKDDGRSAA